MDKYYEHEEEFKEALRGHKMYVQLLLPFDKQIEEMNKDMAEAVEKKRAIKKKAKK